MRALARIDFYQDQYLIFIKKIRRKRCNPTKTACPWCVKKVARSEIWRRSTAFDFSQLYFGSNGLASKAKGTIT
jgi:hypothetical protein